MGTKKQIPTGKANHHTTRNHQPGNLGLQQKLPQLRLRKPNNQTLLPNHMPTPHKKATTVTKKPQKENKVSESQHGPPKT
jgi:hypothetical protein